MLDRTGRGCRLDVAVRILVTLLLIWSWPVRANDASPRFSLGLTDSDLGTASYAAVTFDIAIGALSLGRPRSALDDPGFAAPGLSLALPRSQAGLAAFSDRLGPGLLFESEPLQRLTLSGSWHDKKNEDRSFVALSGRYLPGISETIGTIAIYGGAEIGGSDDVYRLGTSLTRGRATAGLDLTAEDGPSRRQISGVYLGLEVTETLSVGLSRDITSDRDGVDL